ncbi:glycosyltransferase [Halosimplex aquaticum]|uniref:Glycosyltransferase n=1 Tax=Halosimplex aquaticum TaxID=3026162 RepID=A0ABD5Y0X6_9EURY|nr:glycosyltransferase [Halosimplex aquaticum]
MADRPPTSVILPTVRWTDACAEAADQLDPGDELLVVHDDETDPVADRTGPLPANVRIVAAGEPSGCSGKANAVAAGIEAAAHDRIVCTDDDFHHPPDWLDALHADYEVHGPVSEVPVFVGRDPLAVLLEPVYLVGATLVTYANDYAWGGSVTFDRSDIDDEAALCDRLRRTVSDDGVLTDALDVTAVDRTRRVAIGGSVRETLERHVRFNKLVRQHDPGGTAASVAVVLLIVALSVAFPLGSAAVLTALTAAAYARFGVARPTFLLAFPSLVASVPLGVYAHLRRTFVWCGRRYRWRSRFDVDVVERVRR